MTDAMQGLATGNREGKPDTREQTILTPQCIVDVCPCDAPGSLTDAVYSRRSDMGDDGLAWEWPHGTYINPPYKDLKAWMAKAHTCGVEHIMLAPVRPHRKWWREYAEGCNRVCFLDPVTFVGYNQPFPAPLALFYRGPKWAAFEWSVLALGECVSINRRT
jgi:hypothetical protein